MILNRKRDGEGRRHGIQVLRLSSPQERMVKERKALERALILQPPPKVMVPVMELDSKTRAACKKHWLSSQPQAVI